MTRGVFPREALLARGELLRRMNVFVTGALAELHQGLSK
jgi:hypothetical protein